MRTVNYLRLHDSEHGSANKQKEMKGIGKVTEVTSEACEGLLIHESTTIINLKN